MGFVSFIRSSRYNRISLVSLDYEPTKLWKNKFYFHSSLYFVYAEILNNDTPTKATDRDLLFYMLVASSKSL